MKLIILDRDGVINQDSSEFVKTADEWIALPGSLEAIARFYHAGYKLVVATNQSGLGRGLFDIHALNAMHDKLQTSLRELGAKIDAFFICPHHPFVATTSSLKASLPLATHYAIYKPLLVLVLVLISS